jgi:5-deoxy-D-glucuronate isomerase
MRTTAHALEPQKKCFDTLHHAFGDTATILRLAVSDNKGTVTILVPDGYHPVATISDRWLSTVS